MLKSEQARSRIMKVKRCKAMGDYYGEIGGSDHEYDSCWLTGNYDGQYCELCPHKGECSGYEDEDDD